MMVDKSTCKSQTVDQTVSPTAKIGTDPKVADSRCAINDPRRGKMTPTGSPVTSNLFMQTRQMGHMPTWAALATFRL